MKNRIAFIASIVLVGALLLVIFTAQPEPAPVEVASQPTLAQQPSNGDYFQSTVQEAKYLLNSEDPRVWRRAMMSE